jgi:hypothetical protein
MDLYTINVKRYKAIYHQALIGNILQVGALFILLRGGFRLIDDLKSIKVITIPLFGVILAMVVFHTYYVRNRLNKLGDIPDFDERVNEHMKIYKVRLLWHFLSCLLSCFLGVLTGRELFFYFSLIDTLGMLPLYPNLAIFKRELKNDDIIFY